MTVASIKSGLYSAASVAATGATSQASNAAAKIAATATTYVSQSIWGKPSAPQYDHDFKWDAMTTWQPPLNKFNHQEKQGGDTKGTAAEGPFPSLLTHQRHSTERKGVKFDEFEVYYDPLGLSNEWHCPAAKCEQETARRERLWAEWRAKPEREARRIHQKPQLRVEGRLVDTTSIATRTDHGLKEIFYSDEERKSGWGQAPIPGTLCIM